jgi:tRNA nucleotidyltransferase (CCA-adding enzyme)
MDLILCHQTVDFDALGAAIGLSLLKRGARIVLTSGANPVVRNFWALYRDEFASIELRSVNPTQIRSIFVVDTQKRDRLGKAAAWFELKQIKEIEVYDHHLGVICDIPATYKEIEPVGATTTLMVEKLQQAGIEIVPIAATAMALGIHVDTGSLTFEQTTPRDAAALAWLLEKGANLKVIAEYVETSLSPQLQQLLQRVLDELATEKVRGHTVAWVLLETDSFVAGLSNLASLAIELTEADILLLGHSYQRQPDSSNKKKRLTVIGRSRLETVDLNSIFASFNGGGHTAAAALSWDCIDAMAVLGEIIGQVISQIPHPPTARDLMSAPVRTIIPETTIEQAQRILLRYGHSGLSVVDSAGNLVGVISRRDLDLALHHGFSHAPVKGFMAKNLKTITPDTLLPEIEALMVTYDVGRLPVLENGQLAGIVTRTDVLRQLHREKQQLTPQLQQADNESKSPFLKEDLGGSLSSSQLLPLLSSRLHPTIWELLQQIAAEARQRGWHIYLVGGGVRDLLLFTTTESLLLQDIDLVVDGFDRSADSGAGVILANIIQKLYPQVRLSIHGAFQTAALAWHKDPLFGSLCLDIATARTEFYPYPAANPEVEASSIRQDLYRRDFSINALAVRLSEPNAGELLDFFGGLLDLRSKQVRVLHANSFIEDPTRIYRAVRFTVRLGFRLEERTEEYIRYAIASGVFDRLRLENHPAPALTTRLRAELESILEANYWKPALILLDNLQALCCLHSQLELTPELWWQVRCVSRWLLRLDGAEKIDRWLLRLEILLASLPATERVKVAINLQLPKESIDRLSHLEEAENKMNKELPNLSLPSQIFKLLRCYSCPSLIVIAARNNNSIRRIIWQYLTHWSKVESPLNGNDLKQMGYKPSPMFKEMLEALLMATLDGEATDRVSAERFLKRFDRR